MAVIVVLAAGFVAAPGVWAWGALAALFVLGGFLAFTGRLRSPLERVRRR
jgi:hypothetical protein